jgi:hypothetical protein
LRNAFVNMLAMSTDLGQAIAYYAVAPPVSLSLVIKLHNALEDHSIWQQVSDDSNADSTNNAMEYGA